MFIRVYTPFRDYDGPFFPSKLEDLSPYTKGSYKAGWFIKNTKYPNFRDIVPLITKDGYLWSSSICFIYDEIETLILIPYSRKMIPGFDPDGHRERSVAVYAKDLDGRSIDENSLNNCLQFLINRLEANVPCAY